MIVLYKPAKIEYDGEKEACQLNPVGETMRSFFFIRHGEPEFPDQQPVCLGSEELRLSITGVQESYETCALFTGMRFSLFSSPRIQAVDTAKHFGKMITLLDDLRERDMGIFDGKTYQQIQTRYPDLYARFQVDPMLDPPGGEKRNDARQRFAGAVEWIRKCCPGDAVIVTHKDVMELFLGVPAPCYSGFLQFEVDDEKPEPERYRLVRRIETRQDKDNLWWF